MATMKPSLADDPSSIVNTRRPIKHPSVTAGIEQTIQVVYNSIVIEKSITADALPNLIISRGELADYIAVVINAVNLAVARIKQIDIGCHSIPVKKGVGRIDDSGS